MRTSENYRELAAEDELAKLCPDCELGAFPPLGNLYGMHMWIDRALGDSEEIVFNAGSHRDALRMKYPDYLKRTSPGARPRRSRVFESR